MKKIILSIAVLFMAISFGYSQDEKVDSAKEESSTLISFENIIYDYGKIEYKSSGACEFKFKNAGKNPLIISNVKPSCGCTLVDGWKKEPINPGEESTIKISYDTKRTGKFTKNISVYSNGSSAPVRLTIKGEIGANPEAAQPKNAEEKAEEKK